jgi:hypothetical protein
MLCFGNYFVLTAMTSAKLMTVMAHPQKADGHLRGKKIPGGTRDKTVCGAAVLKTTAGLFLLSIAVGGCSGSSLTGPGTEANAQAASPSLSDRIGGFISGNPVESRNAPAAGGPPPDEIHCPAVDVRDGASTLMVPPPSAEPNPLALKYQGTIGTLARECKVSNGVMHVRVGMQGHVIVGPAGGAGQIDVPIRYAVVKEGPNPQTIATDFARVAVAIPGGDANVAFTHVDDAMSFPVPKDTSDLDMYVIYVGYDPLGAKPAKPQHHRAPKKKRG